MSRVNKMLAVAALAMAASSPMAVSPNIGYTIPKKWAPSAGSGNNKSPSKASKARAKAKMAAKSRRDQRKAAKR